jgi:hypothetical protein
MIEQDVAGGSGAPPTLAIVLEAWRAAERRLAAGDGDRAANAIEVRRLRDEYRRLQDERIAEGAWPEDGPTNGSPPVALNALAAGGLGRAGS